jgi:hypothetical protein
MRPPGRRRRRAIAKYSAEYRLATPAFFGGGGSAVMRSYWRVVACRK